MGGFQGCSTNSSTSACMWLLLHQQTLQHYMPHHRGWEQDSPERAAGGVAVCQHSRRQENKTSAIEGLLGRSWLTHPRPVAHQGAYPSCLVEPSAKRNQRDDLRGVWGKSCAWVTPTVALCPCLYAWPCCLCCCTAQRAVVKEMDGSLGILQA